MTQTFFNHFNCRTLSDERSVLEADYSVECATASTEDGIKWVVVAVLSMVGIAFVIGVPVGMWYKMRKFFAEKQQLTQELKISQVVAYRDFHRQFGYMSGDFRPEAYYAESVDLFRKLSMTGVLVLLAPGTIIQSFCSVILSMFFLAVQIKLWPYPHLGANMLKAFTDLQIFLVTLVGLVLRIRPEELQKDPLSKGFILCVIEGRPCGDAGNDVDGITQTAAASFYGDMLLLLLILTLIPVVLSVWKHSDVQNAQRFLLEAAYTVHQPPGPLDCLCCNRQKRKRKQLDERRAELRRRATVTSLRLDGVSIADLSDIDQATMKRAIIHAVCSINAIEKKSLTNVQLLPGGADALIAKVYFRTSQDKYELEQAIQAFDVKIRHDDYTYTAHPLDREESTARHILQESMRQSVAAMQMGQREHDDQRVVADDPVRDAGYAARQASLEESERWVMEETQALMGDSDDEPPEAEPEPEPEPVWDEQERWDEDNPPPSMPDARFSVMPDTEAPPAEGDPPESTPPAQQQRTPRPTPRKELMDIYKQHNPRKLADVDRLISEWSTKPECVARGGVQTLLKKVRAKYGVTVVEEPEPEREPEPEPELVTDPPPPAMPRESVVPDQAFSVQQTKPNLRV